MSNEGPSPDSGLVDAARLVYETFKRSLPQDQLSERIEYYQRLIQRSCEKHQCGPVDGAVHLADLIRQKMPDSQLQQQFCIAALFALTQPEST